MHEQTPIHAAAEGESRPFAPASEAAPALPFRFHRLRFQFEAREGIHFPVHKSTNILRGAFGEIFRRIACVPECREPGVCPLAGGCPYEQIFAPVARGKGPSGFRDLPRPIVLRASHLDGRTFAPGEAFRFDVHLFRPHPESAAFLTLAFAQFATEGIGPGRGRASLRAASVLALDGGEGYRFFAEGIFEEAAFPEAREMQLPLGGPAFDPAHSSGEEQDALLGIRYVTPMELKHEGRLAGRPEMDIVMARVFDRISALAHFYGEASATEQELREGRERLLESAARIRIARSNLEHVHAARISSRTGQRHNLEGFVGDVQYEGPAAAFGVIRPWLEAGAIAGVGRQTVWGKGELCLMG